MPPSPLFEAVLPQPPGTATRAKVGFGMYWLMWSRIASLVRPSTSTYLIASLYFLGRNFVSASWFS